MQNEENPFETKRVSELWIQSVENEKGQIRDLYFYPLLRKWLVQNMIKNVLDIGGGQGVASQFCSEISYTNIEPSRHLVDRARRVHGQNGTHVEGNVYKMPFQDNTFDGAFSITVWFHLKDLNQASKELSRVLVEGGKFLIINPNPEAYEIWQTFYSNIEIIDEKSFVGSVSVPHAVLPRNTFYKHTDDEIIDSLRSCGLIVDDTKDFAPMSVRFGSVNKDCNLFVYYIGHKSD